MPLSNIWRGQPSLRLRIDERITSNHGTMMIIWIGRAAQNSGVSTIVGRSRSRLTHVVGQAEGLAGHVGAAVLKRRVHHSLHWQITMLHLTHIILRNRRVREVWKISVLLHSEVLACVPLETRLRPPKVIRHDFRLSIINIGVAWPLLELGVLLLVLAGVKLALIGGLKDVSLIVAASWLKSLLLLPTLLLLLILLYLIGWRVIRILGLLGLILAALFPLTRTVLWACDRELLWAGGIVGAHGLLLLHTSPIVWQVRVATRRDVVVGRISSSLV